MQLGVVFPLPPGALHPSVVHTGVPVRAGSKQHVKTPPLLGRAPLHLPSDLDLTLCIQQNVVSLTEEPLTHRMSFYSAEPAPFYPSFPLPSAL